MSREPKFSDQSIIRITIPEKGAIQIETLDLVNKLEDLVENSRQLFNTAFVNTEEFYNLVNKIRASLPEDVKTAARITRDADRVINDAKEQAAQITDQAKADAANIVEAARVESTRLVDASEIKQMATAQAKEIVASSEEEARSVKAGSDEYAREVLSDLEGFVAKVLSTIQRGRDKLDAKGPETENE